jgi:hypothetical protein
MCCCVLVAVPQVLLQASQVNTLPWQLSSCGANALMQEVLARLVGEVGRRINVSSSSSITVFDWRCVVVLMRGACRHATWDAAQGSSWNVDRACGMHHRHCHSFESGQW